MLRKYFQLDTRIVLAVLILIELAFNLVLQYYAVNDEVLYNSLAQELTIEEVESTIRMTHSSAWGVFLWAPLSILAQLFFITVCINIGTLLLRYDIRFKEIFGVVTKAFIIFAIARLLLIAMYTSFGVNQLSDLDFLSRFSLYSVLNKEALPDWAIFPLQKINLFQMLFILLLAIGLNTLQHRGTRRWIPFVLATYGTGLIISIVLIIFLTFL